MKTAWKEDRFTCIAFAVFVFLFFVLCIYICPRAWKLVDSDMSAELVLADILDRENALITKSWYYSTEIKVFHTNLLYTILFKLLPGWHAPRVASYPVLFAILVVSAWFFCKRMGRAETFPFVGGALILPFSDLYFRYALKGGYYLPYIIISFFALALTLHFMREPDKKKRLWILAGAVILSFISGLNGPRQMLVLYLPLALSVCILLLEALAGIDGKADIWRGWWDSFSWNRLLVIVVCTFFGNALGSFVNATTLAEGYRFARWSGLNFIPFDFDRVFLVIAGLLNNFGYVAGPMGAGSVITNAVALILFACTLLACVFAIRYRKKISAEYYFFTLFFLCSVLTFALLYALTDMAYQDLYNLPLIVFAYPLIFMGLKEAGILSSFQRISMAAIGALMVIASLSIYNTYKDVDQTADLRAMAELLESQGYTQGYATFWNANVLTELSDGAIEMWSWNSTTESGFGMQEITGIDQINPWLQKASHMSERPAGKVFLLLTEGELSDCVFRHALAEEDVLCRAGVYTAYGYEVETYEEMLNRLSRHVGFENMYERGIEDAGGKKAVLPAGEIFGPYMHFYQGTYHVTVTGGDVDVLSCSAAYNIDEAPIEGVSVVESDPYRIVFAIPVASDLENCSVLLHNRSEKQALIDDIVIERVGP